MEMEGISSSLLPEKQVRSTQQKELSIPILREEMEERSPSQLLAVTLPLVFWIPPPLMQVEGISTSLLPKTGRSTQLLNWLRLSRSQEMEERSTSQLLAVTLPLLLWIPPPWVKWREYQPLCYRRNRCDQHNCWNGFD